MKPRAQSTRLILTRPAKNQSVRSADFEEHDAKYESGWGQRSSVTDSLALLWFQGKIVPAGRAGGGRRWALAKEWFGAPLTAVPPRRVALRSAAVRSLRALGIATQQQVRAHFIRRRYEG